MDAIANSIAVIPFAIFCAAGFLAFNNCFLFFDIDQMVTYLVLQGICGLLNCIPLHKLNVAQGKYALKMLMTVIREKLNG